MANDNPYAEDFNDNHNPFQAPQTPFDTDGLHNTNAEAIRREHLSHEASVKSVGLLYMLGGAVMVLASIGMLYFMAAGRAPGQGANTGVLFLLPLLAIVQCFTAVGLRRLRSWARIPAGILSVIGLLGFPIGTLINGYILYLLFSVKGAMVFSEEYQQIMEQTPHIKYKTSIVVWIFLGLLAVLLLFAFTVAFVG